MSHSASSSLLLPSASFDSAALPPPPADPYGNSGYGGYSGGYEPPPPPPDQLGDDDELGTATALYDYTGTSDEDLSFRAGCVLTVVREDSGGWTCGRDANGNVGIFPTSYVRRDA
eukprot:TRINITY_DN5593_c0_g1_i2.p3 TRINITY_DN5593_c0_g1~~TRINITY_DN5593_c0_g1_i2.p3  ORF type:complete len:115 (-),score=50.92 TRINITY_DN5593_c0_g1_i2:448-792(-)